MRRDPYTCQRVDRVLTSGPISNLESAMLSIRTQMVNTDDQS